MQAPLSSPFRLRERLRKPDARISSTALAAVLLIALFLSMLTSKYIFAPGLAVDLQPQNGKVSATEHGNFSERDLPVYDGELPGEETSSVLTVKSDSMFILDGHIYEKLDTAFKQHSKEKNKGILLVKMNKSASIQGLFNISKLARDAGFSSIRIAGESVSSKPTE